MNTQRYDEAERRLGEFEADLDRWGPDLDKWPAGSRNAAETLLAMSAEARRQFAAAGRVDAVLDAMMRTDVVAAPRRPVSARPAVRAVARWGMAAIAASLLVGYVAGSLLPSTEEDDGGRIFIAVQDGDDLGGVL